MGLKRFTKYKEKLDSGFGSNASNEGYRLLNKNGSYNIQKNGLSFFQKFSLFHSLINMTWIQFFGFLFIGYLLVNLIFAGVYMLIGTSGLSGVSGVSDSEQFLDAFFFSTQTLTTVGYGAISPNTPSISLVASIESFVGLLGFAIATGLLYGRFSKPQAKIIFSDYALISPYREGKGLMIRIANLRDSQLINMKAKILFSQIEEEGKRKFYTLDLEINHISLLATSWTIVHPIDEHSPLFEVGKNEIAAKNVEIMLLLEGYDESYSQAIHARTSFKANEMIFDSKFVSILGHNEQGKSTVSLDALSNFEKV